VIPLPEQHSEQWVEHEAFLSTQGYSHYSPDVATSIRFSKAMFDTYQRMVGESMFYRHQVSRQQFNEVEDTTQELKEA
jgi:hypothetical protein